MAVSKGVPPEPIAQARSAGLTTFGENRVQEAATKAAMLPGISWHLVGRLQSNKAARAVELFDAIHSVDSIELARRLDRLAEGRSRRLVVYLQVNVEDDPTKAGFSPGELEDVLPALLDLRALESRGLMTIGRPVDDAERARPAFAALRQLSERLRARHPLLGGGLSMGMSADFEAAVEEGATSVRVGTAIFGRRG